MLQALQIDYYIVMACCVISSACALCLPKDIKVILIAKHSTNVNNDIIDRPEGKFTYKSIKMWRLLHCFNNYKLTTR